MLHRCLPYAEEGELLQLLRDGAENEACPVLPGKLYPSGSEALAACVRHLALPEDSDIILPAFTCCSVAHTMRRVLPQARLTLIDQDPETLAIDLDSLRAAVSRKTRAIIVPALFGNRQAMAPCRELVGSTCHIIEDLAHLPEAEPVVAPEADYAFTSHQV